MSPDPTPFYLTENKFLTQPIQPFITCDEETKQQILKNQEIVKRLRDRSEEMSNMAKNKPFNHPMSIVNTELLTILGEEE